MFIIRAARIPGKNGICLHFKSRLHWGLSGFGSFLVKSLVYVFVIYSYKINKILRLWSLNTLNKTLTRVRQHNRQLPRNDILTVLLDVVWYCNGILMHLSSTLSNAAKCDKDKNHVTKLNLCLKSLTTATQNVYFTGRLFSVARCNLILIFKLNHMFSIFGITIKCYNDKNNIKQLNWE